MKRIGIFKRMVIFVAIATLYVASMNNRVIAQATVLNVSQQSDASIIRHYNGNNYIVYHKNGNQSFFSYLDANGNSMTYAKFSSLGIVVNDFEIYGDYALFCGKRSTNAIFGYFNIGDLINGTLSNIDCFSIISFGGYCCDSLRRIDAFIGTSDNSLHLVMVGDCTDMQQGIPCHCVIDARTTTLPTTWFLIDAMTYIKNHEEYFDITVSDRLVITADRIGSDNSVRFFDKPLDFASSIFSTNFYTANIYIKPYYGAWAQYSPVVKNLIHDQSIYVSPYPNSQISISIHDGIMDVGNYLIDIAPYTVVNGIKDIATKYPNVFFIQDAMDPLGNPVSLFFHAIMSGYSFSTICMSVTNTGALQSVASHTPAYNTVLSGYTTSSDLEFVKYIAPATCAPYISTFTNPVSNPDVHTQYETEVFNFILTRNAEPVTISVDTVSTICF